MLGEITDTGESLPEAKTFPRHYGLLKGLDSSTSRGDIFEIPGDDEDLVCKERTMPTRTKTRPEPTTLYSSKSYANARQSASQRLKEVGSKQDKAQNRQRGRPKVSKAERRLSEDLAEATVHRGTPAQSLPPTPPEKTIQVPGPTADTQPPSLRQTSAKQHRNEQTKPSDQERNTDTEVDEVDHEKDKCASPHGDQYETGDLFGQLEQWETIQGTIDKLRAKRKDRTTKPKSQFGQDLVGLIAEMASYYVSILDNHDCLNPVDDQLDSYLEDFKKKISHPEVLDDQFRSVMREIYVYVMPDFIEMIGIGFQLHAATFSASASATQCQCLRDMHHIIETSTSLCKKLPSHKLPASSVKSTSKGLLPALQSLQDGFKEALDSMDAVSKRQREKEALATLAEEREKLDQAYEEEKRRDKEERLRLRSEEVAKFSGSSVAVRAQPKPPAKTKCSEWSFEMDDELLQCLALFAHLPRMCPEDH